MSLGKNDAIKGANLVYDASAAVVVGYALATVFLFGIGLAVSNALIAVPLMHPA